MNGTTFQLSDTLSGRTRLRPAPVLRIFQADPSHFARADFFSAMHQSAFCVRMKMSPSETAREALSGSPSELTASNSNFGLAFSTNVSPEWLMA